MFQGMLHFVIQLILSITSGMGVFLGLAQIDILPYNKISMLVLIRQITYMSRLMTDQLAEHLLS
jgi:hypothetical protein